MKNIITTKIRFIIEEITLSSSSRFFSYLINIGIKVEVNAPVIRSSNIKSGIRKEAKKMSRSSLEKYPERIRKRKKPKNPDMPIITERINAEENILFCFTYKNSFVFDKN
jgi:hypothetical protein